MKAIKKAIKKAFLGLITLVAVFVVASCKKENPAEAAASTLQLVQNHQEVIDNFQVTSVLPYEGVDYTVTWSTDKTDVAKVSATASNSFYTIEITRPADEDVRVILTATVSDGENSATKKFDFTVLKELAPNFENFYNTATDDPVSFTGVVIAKQEYSESYGNTSVSLRALDGQGAVYVYRIKCSKDDYDKMVRGTVVSISGNKDNYNGSMQIVDSTSVEFTGETQDVQPIDISEEVKDGIWTNGPAYNSMDEYIKYHVGDLVRLENIKVLDKVGPKSASDSDITYTMGYGDGQTIKVQLKYSSFNNEHEIYKLWSSLTVGETISGNFVVNYRSGDSEAPNARLYITDLASDLERSETMASVEAAAAQELEESVASLLPNYIDSSNLISSEGIKLPQVTDDRVVVEWLVADKNTSVIEVTDDCILKMADSYTLPSDLSTVVLRANIKVDDEVLGSNVDESGNGKLVDFSIWAKQSLSTWDKYYVAKKDEAVNASGVAYAVGFKKNDDDDLGTGYALVQSAEGAYYLMAYNVVEADWKAKFALKHNVTFAGTKNEYNGKLEVMIEAKDLATSVTTGEEATDPTPTDITSIVSEGNLDKLAFKQGMYVKVTGAVYSSGKLTINSNSIAIYKDAYFYSYDNLEEGATYTVSGYLNYYKGYQISPIKDGDITKTSDADEVGEEVSYDAEMHAVVSINTPMDDGQIDASLVNLDGAKFEVEVAKNDGSTKVALNGDSTIRLYPDVKNGGGCSITVSTIDNKKIAKIVITWYAYNAEAAMKVTGLDNNQTAGTNDGDQTVEVIYSDPVTTFTIQNVGQAKSSQVRIKSVQIYYAD